MSSWIPSEKSLMGEELIENCSPATFCLPVRSRVSMMVLRVSFFWPRRREGRRADSTAEENKAVVCQGEVGSKLVREGGKREGRERGTRMEEWL